MIGKNLSNRYEITGELGRGGMGVVYRAHDPLLDREVAVKLIPPTMLNPETEQRFQHEAKLVAQMDHPAIVSIYDFGYDEGSLFFVMPIVKGRTLTALLRDDTLSLGDVLDIGIKVAEALDYSHAPRGDSATKGVIHRDIKPDNIMVMREEDGLRLRVMDFGVARIATEERITKTGTIVGTPAYLSPEQVTAKDIDSRSDIYSLGVVLYECVVGQPPFTGDVQSILYRIVNEFPQSPRSVGASIDEEFERLILDCLAKDPAKRPQRAGEVATALKRYRERLKDSDRALTLVLTRTIKMPRPALPTFVGREKELSELHRKLNVAVAGECQFVVVAGEPGIGKTRLLDEIENLAKVRKIRVLHGQFVEQDRSYPYQGFCEAIQEYFRFKDTGNSSSVGATDLSDLAGGLVSLFPMLTEIDEIRAATTTGGSAARPTPESHTLENRTAIFELLARTLTRIGGGQPLVLLLEHLHGGEVSIEALPYIVRRLGPTPTLIIGTYRTSEIDRHHPLTQMLDSFRGDRHFSQITLGPFSPSEHRLYLETLVGGPNITNSLAEKLYEGTEGNPFFTKEMVRSLLDSGGIAKDDTGAWNLTGETGLGTDNLPATIQQVVERRIERLPKDLREVLSVAAVIGRTFESRDLEILTEDNADLDDAIDRLILDGLIEEERESRGDRLTFSSGVVRDVLYAELSRRRRRSLHRKYAEHIEKRHEGRLARFYPQLVYHYSQADIGEKTVEFALRHARASLDAFSPEEATRAVKTALEFLDQEWEGESWHEGEARLLLAQAHRMSGDIDGALREIEAANAILEREKQSALAVSALLLAAEIAWQARRTEDTRRWVELGLTAARAAGDTESLKQLLSLAATLANLLGEYEKSNNYVDEAARLGSESAEAETEEEIPHGGTLVVALANPVNTLEPVLLELIEELEILTNVFEPLLATDRDGNLVPNLCEKWEVSEQGKSVTLTLRNDIRFQDGHRLTAADVKKSFERSVRLPNADTPPAIAAIRGAAEFTAGDTDDLAGIIVHAEDQLEIELHEPLSIYPALLTDAHTGIARESAASGDGARHVYGTGPFQVLSQTSDRIVLQRNADYWKGNPARLETVEFRPGLNAAKIASGLRTGDYDLAGDLLPRDLDDILRDPRFRRGLNEIPKKTTYYALWNTATGLAAQNPTLRKALSGVVRTHELVWQTLGRFAQPAACLIPPGLLGHDPGKRRNVLTQAEALEMLRSGGFPAKIELKASLHPILRDRYASLLAALFSLWSELGVEVLVETADMAAYLESWQKADGLDLLIGRWNADYDDPDDFTHYLFHSRAGIFRNYFSSSEADRILEDARAESRPRSREVLYRKFENLLQDWGVLVPLFHDIDYRVASQKVRGLKLRSTPPYVNYSELGKVEKVSTTDVPRVSGGIIHVPVAGMVNNLDPAISATAQQVEVIGSIFETLVRVVGGTRIVPWLASDFSVDAGGKQYRFRLRDDVRFHDGRRLTARDVRYSFERLLQQNESETRWFYSPIRGAKALLNGTSDDLTGFRIHSANEFTIELDEPVSFFPALISFNSVSIVPEGSSQFNTSWQQGCVGTGPFRVVEYEQGRFVELDANRNYWRKGFPKCDGLIYEFGITPDEIMQGFRDARFALAYDLFPADVEALRRDPEFAAGYRETPSLSTYFLAFNIHREPLSDKQLRQSLVASLDVPTLVRQTLGRIGVPAHGIIPPGLVGHNPKQTSRSSYAMATTPLRRGESLIELKAAINPVYFGEHAIIFEQLASTLRELNLKICPMNKTGPEFAELRQQGVADLLVTRWIADYPDADTFVHLLHSREGYIGRFCGTPETDRLIERGRAETSPSVRHSLYREIEEIVAREALILPLFHEQAYRFARPEIGGVSVSFWGQVVDYSNLRLTK